MKALFFIVTVSCLVLDQVTKFGARMLAEGVEGRSISALWPGVFELKLVFNEGIAFGMFQGAGVFLTPIAACIAFGAAWYSLRHPGEPRSSHVTMALLCAGALGNLIDRVAFGKVTDMFWIRAIDFPVFNVADVCITVAGFMLAISVLFELVHPKEQGAESKEQEQEREQEQEQEQGAGSREQELEQERESAT